MKKTFLLLCLFSYILLNAQTSTIEKEKVFETKLKDVLDKYTTSTEMVDNDSKKKTQIIEPILQNKRLTKAFNQIIFSNSDLVDNASAFGISQNKEGTTVSINSYFHLSGKSRNQLFLKAGINSVGGSGIFNLYARDAWKSSIGGNLGFIWKVGGSTLTNENIPKLDYNLVLREIYIRDSILKDLTVNYSLKNYQEIRSKYVQLKNYPQIKEYKDKKELLIAYLKILEKNETFYKELEGNKSLKKPVQTQIQKENNEKSSEETKNEVNLKFATYTNTENNNNDKIISLLLKEFWSEKNELNTIEKVGILQKIAKIFEFKKDTKLKSEIKKVAAVYDDKHIKNTGYSFHWLDLNTALNNNTFGFSEAKENINSDVKEAFDAYEATKTGINKLKVAVDINYNYTSNKTRGVWYLKAGLQYNSGSFLNSNLISGTPHIDSSNSTGLFLIKDYIDEEAQDDVLGAFDSIKKNLKFGAFNFYTAYYFGKKKSIGVNLSAAHRYLISKPEHTFYKNNYSIFLGPIFRKTKADDDTGLTFGIDIGYDNALYSRNAKDNFVARIRVGIPIKLYDIKNN
ncbi:hypothetical protein BW723_14700 [Polaribacter reichenbachii]|uniref:Uncharacterized protein n=1 Tax=Polaribacter reichenbachii TaxID=996801 RepID=A0A1B8U4B9_9FLAO|nr:hypothetical protein [Polaribacter reichenbachii]APZ47457.1 hypothetical protein BW723_14700 [Polaribacter reichenbachii]AUC18096.1 hypothetical protein BTO17_05140 [Polaribacter reichenbachii]OBY66707.1 hypothetical protein LPB301_05770 [Polaribacter reichenbachii]